MIIPGAAAEFATKLVKSADQSVNNSTTKVNCTELVLPVGANDVWLVYMLILYDADGAADLRYAFTGPAAAEFTWGRYLDSENNTIAVQQQKAGAGVGTLNVGQVWGIYRGGGTAGNLQFTFAQWTANVSDTTIRKGSSMTCVKLI